MKRHGDWAASMLGDVGPKKDLKGVSMYVVLLYMLLAPVLVGGASPQDP